MEKQNLTIVGNWKMHGHQQIAEGLLASIASVSEQRDIQIVVCPPALLVSAVVAALKGTPVKTGGQDCHAQKEGAFTGDTSAEMLHAMGCRYVIVGHSERRSLHHETDADVHAKALQAMACGLTPIICIGETAVQREAGQAEAVVEKQLIDSIPAGKGQFLLAYEPVWAIGSGKTPTVIDISHMHRHINSVVSRHSGGLAGVLYGGSVKAANAAEILKADGVAGVLVGGASLKAEEFCGIIAAAAALKKD